MKTLVVSLNPAVDVEWMLDRVRPLEKNEVVSERRWPGGKGINVVRWLRWLGVGGRLFVPLGGEPGRELWRGLRGEGIPVWRYPLGEPSRVNVIVTPTEGPQLRFNPQWPRFSARERAGVFGALWERMRGFGLVVLSGALPGTLERGVYARLVRRGRSLGCRVVLDCDGEPFQRGVEEGPFLVKPNEMELALDAGRPLTTESGERLAVRRLGLRTGGWVLYSRGARGAWLVHAREGCGWSAAAPVAAVRNTVGAGDAMLAAACASMGRGEAPEEWLAQAVSTASLAVGMPPGVMPPLRVKRPRVEVRRIGGGAGRRRATAFGEVGRARAGRSTAGR